MLGTIGRNYPRRKQTAPAHRLQLLHVALLLVRREVRSGFLVKLSLGTTLFLRALKLFLLDYRRGTFRLRSQAEQLQSSAPELLAIAGTYVEVTVCC